jgi:alpha-D-ribose 1-methylphosphonate 5-triphosphate diphosphatase PhnM
MVDSGLLTCFAAILVGNGALAVLTLQELNKLSKQIENSPIRVKNRVLFMFKGNNL